MSTTSEDSNFNNGKFGFRNHCNIPMAPHLALPQFSIPKDLMTVLKTEAKYVGTNKTCQSYLDLLSKLPNIENLDSEHYLSVVAFLLYLEEYQSIVHMKEYDLNNQKITLSKYNRDQIVIGVPGLAEDRPSVKVHDKIDIREVNGSNRAITNVTFVGRNYIKATVPCFFINNFKDDQLYNVRFCFQNWHFRCCHYALHVTYENELTPMVFPKIIPRCYYPPYRNLDWFNENIENNPEQKQAILNIIGRTALPAPYILFGPPGTGKTATLVEAICQIWKGSRFNRVLICTPSNAAADEITKRLLKYIPAQDMYRMYGPSRSMNDVDKNILPSSNFVETDVIFLPREIIIQKRIVICTLVSCTRLLSLKLWKNHFMYVFMDEAGQATEPETLIPLGLVNGSTLTDRGNLIGQIVIAGDPQQLGPCVLSRLAERLLGQSMLERLMKQCAPYQKDKNDQLNPTYITKLVQNYRNHEAILHVPNKLFYDNELRVCGDADAIQRATSWSMLPNKDFPVIFHAVDGKEQREDYSPSIYNMSEIKVIMDYVKKLNGVQFGKQKLQQKDIGIITPYKLQKTKICGALAQQKLNDISVGTVEVFQGQERDVIILSTVRSVLFTHKKNLHIGFLSNPKRFNVAMTRAKALLIVIGNPKVLQVDDCWREFLQYCLKNGACRGHPFTLNQNFTKRQIQKLIGEKHVVKQYQNDDNMLDVEEEDNVELSCKSPVSKLRRLPELSGLEINVNYNWSNYQRIIPNENLRIPDYGVLSYSGSNSSSTNTDSELEIESNSSEISMSELYHENSKLPRNGLEIERSSSEISMSELYHENSKLPRNGLEIERSSSEISMSELYHEISKLPCDEKLETDLCVSTMTTFQRANENVDYLWKACNEISEGL